MHEERYFIIVRNNGTFFEELIEEIGEARQVFWAFLLSNAWQFSTKKEAETVCQKIGGIVVQVELKLFAPEGA